MSYKNKRDLVFSGESRSLYVVYASFGLIILLALIFREEGAPKYWLVGVCLVLLLISWVAAKYFMKPVTCQSCEQDLRPSIMQLGKAARTGYCPKCGNEIV